MELKVKVNNAPSKGKITASNGKMTSKMIKVSFENRNAPTGQKMTYTAKIKKISGESHYFSGGMKAN